MILNIILFKNVKINAFTNPNFTDLEPEKAAKGLERALIANFDEDKKLVKSYENLDMYFIGTFDDETGEIYNCEPRLLFSPREVILSLTAESIKNAGVIKEESKDD